MSIESGVVAEDNAMQCETGSFGTYEQVDLKSEGRYTISTPSKSWGTSIT